MNKTLTLVIPTYNMEKYLRKCLDSLIFKDEHIFETLEVLVVIDGAKDSSSSIAHEYQDKYPNVFRVIDKENGNYGSCINRGLKEANGKYIKVLDADDSFDTDSFTTYLHELRNRDEDLILNNYMRVGEKGEPLSYYSFPFNNESSLTFDQLPYSDMAMHAVAYKTELLRRINYIQSEGISYTDQEWIFIPMAEVETIYYVNHGFLYKYLIGREGQTIAPEVMLKTVKHQVRGLISQIEQLKKIRPTEDKLSYLYCRLGLRLETIYSTYLISSDGKSIDDLKAIDNEYIKNNSRLLLITNNLKHKGFKYVKMWRITGRTSFIPALLWRLRRLIK